MIESDLDRLERKEHGIRHRLRTAYGLSDREANHATICISSNDREGARKLLTAGLEQLQALAGVH